MKSGLPSKLKAILVPSGREARTIKFGLYKGIKLDLDLQNQSQVYLGLSECETNSAIRRAASRAEWHVDVGAAKGEMSIYFSRLANIKRVVAAEPNPEEAATLRKNLTINGVVHGRVELYEKLVGIGTGENVGDYIQLDELNIPLSERGFIKIDVDGFELDVLRSGRRLLSKGQADLLVETHSVQLENDCMAYLTNIGYFCEIIKNAWWRTFLPEQRPSAQCRWLFAERRA